MDLDIQVAATRPLYPHHCKLSRGRRYAVPPTTWSTAHEWATAHVVGDGVGFIQIHTTRSCTSENPIIRFTNRGGLLPEFFLECGSGGEAEGSRQIAKRNRGGGKHRARPVQKKAHPVIELSQKSIAFEQRCGGAAVERACLTKMRDERRRSALRRKIESI